MKQLKHARFVILFVLTLGFSYGFSYVSFGQDDAASSNSFSDKEQIVELVRSMTLWSDNNSISESVIPDDDYSKYVGIDTSELDITILQLEKSNFFTAEFIDNYKRISLEIDRKLKNKEANWPVGQLSPFGPDANPWCLCQDVPFDSPSPWSLLEVETITLNDNSGEFVWKWGGLGENPQWGWGDHTYRFWVEKVDDTWKISALEGFDFEEFTRVKF